MIKSVCPGFRDDFSAMTPKAYPIKEKFITDYIKVKDFFSAKDIKKK